MNWPSCTSVAVVLMLAGSTAYAEPTKVECANANTDGQTLRMSEKFAAARARLEVCQSDACPAVVRSDCAKHFDELERAQPTIVFDVKDASGADVSGVNVAMDGTKPVDRLEGGLLRVDPGSHTFTFTAAGRPSATLRLVINEGEKGRHEHVVVGADTAPARAGADDASRGATTPSTPTSAPESYWSTQRVLGLTAGVQGLAAIAVGAVFGGLSMSYANRQKSDCASESSCPSWSQAVSDHDSAATDGTISTVAFVAGGVLLAGGALLYFTAPASSSTRERQSKMLVAPSAGPGGGGLVLRGGF